MKYHIKKRNQCRLCYKKNLKKILHFDNIPFFDEIVTRDKLGEEFSYPMELYFCNDCASVQTQHDVNITDYYQDYQYVASKSKFMTNYMNKLVDYCKDSLKIKENDNVMEIGSADGYLLSLFQRLGVNVLGFEAAKNLCGLAKKNGVNVVNALFDKSSFHLVPKDFKKVQLLILLHTFDHLYDPVPFLETVKDILCPKRGVLLLEVHDLQDIYDKKETALFGHEHATYLHFNSMQRFLRSNGFRIVDFNFLDKSMIRGSSMLIAATLAQSDVPMIKDISSLSNEKLDQLNTFKNFQTDVEDSFAGLRSYIEEGTKHGKRFVGYGGWGRGVTTLAMAKLKNTHLSFVADANLKLESCFTPSTGFEIRGPMAINISDVDEVIVFNYAYINEIKQALANFIEQGGKVTSVLDILCRAAQNAY